MIGKIRVCTITISHKTQNKLVMQNMLQYTRHTSNFYQKLTFQNSSYNEGQRDALFLTFI